MAEMIAESLVEMVAAAEPGAAEAFFASKLSFETDPSDVYADMKKGAGNFVLIDVRSPGDYARSHAVGAINLPHPRIDETSTAQFSKDRLLVVYCWGPGCNGATRAAAKLSALGFRVKEMIGGIEYWEDRERYPVERG